MRHFSILICYLLSIFLSFPCWSSEESKPPEYPSTVEECVKILEKRESKQTLAGLKATKETDIFKFNRGLGAAIRNDWIWSRPKSPLVQFFFSKGIRQPDGMSAAIIHCLQRDLNNKPFELDKKLGQLRLFEQRQEAVGVEKLMVPQSILDEKLYITDKKTVKLADFRGKLLVLILLDDSSNIDVKQMNQLKSSFEKQSVEFLGLIAFCTDSNFQQFKKDFSANYKLNFPVIIHEPPNFSYKLYKALVDPGIMTYPETFLINKESVMIARYKGWESGTLEIVKRHIEDALAGRELEAVKGK